MGYQCWVIDPETGRRHLVTRRVSGVGENQTVQPLMVHVGGRDAQSEERWTALRERVLAACPRVDTPDPLVGRLQCAAREPLWSAMKARDLEELH
jgi:hypothetical protein